jgi:hypothetical protein
MDGVLDLFSLFAITVFFNVLDERTYQFPAGSQEDDASIERRQKIFDLNAIPVIERYHLCYTRGLSLDLINWFFENYQFSHVDFHVDEIDGYLAILVPFIAHLGRQIVRYKRISVETGHISISTYDQLKHQVVSALFDYKWMKDAYEQAVEDEEAAGYHSDDSDAQSQCSIFYNFDYGDFTNYNISKRQAVHPNADRMTDFLEGGKTLTDRRFFLGLSCHFELFEEGTFCIERRRFIVNFGIESEQDDGDDFYSPDSDNRGSKMQKINCGL